MCAETLDQLHHTPAVHPLVDVIEEFATLTSPIDALGVLARHSHDLGLGEAFIAFDDDAAAVHPASLAPVARTDAFARLRASLTARSGFESTSESVMTDGRGATISPIRRSGEVIGVLGVLEHDGRLPDGAIVGALGSLISTVLDRTRDPARTAFEASLRREYEIAADVQRTFVPSGRVAYPGVEFGTGYDPSLYVGGDFYDWSVHDGILTWSLGDVSGKGMSAALVMSVAQTLRRSSVRSGVFDPSATASVVNDGLYEQLVELGMFITAFFAAYDRTSQTLRYVNAGHSPVVAVRGGDAPEMLAADGPPVGVFPTLELPTQSVVLHPGDAVVACTDGIVEQRNDRDEMFGYERLLDLIDRHRSATAEEMAARIDAALLAFAGDAPRDDDRTVLAMRRR